MDKQDSLKTILNHLLDTAVYVIRQDSHGILYFNDRVKTVTPDIALGQVCHDVWEGSCENCPLKTMDGKQSNTTLSFDDPFGEVVSITATEMMWEEDIPAYVISVTPQVKTKKEQELELACKQLVGVTAQMYPVVLSINLTKNTYNIIEYLSLIHIYDVYCNSGDCRTAAGFVRGSCGDSHRRRCAGR